MGNSKSSSYNMASEKSRSSSASTTKTLKIDDYMKMKDEGNEEASQTRNDSQVPQSEIDKSETGETKSTREIEKSETGETNIKREIAETKTDGESSSETVIVEPEIKNDLGFPVMESKEESREKIEKNNFLENEETKIVTENENHNDSKDGFSSILTKTEGEDKDIAMEPEEIDTLVQVDNEKEDNEAEVARNLLDTGDEMVEEKKEIGEENREVIEEPHAEINNPTDTDGETKDEIKENEAINTDLFTEDAEEKKNLEPETNNEISSSLTGNKIEEQMTPIEAEVKEKADEVFDSEAPRDLATQSGVEITTGKKEEAESGEKDEEEDVEKEKEEIEKANFQRETTARIEEIREKVESVADRVQKFDNSKNSKEFYVLDEALLKNIETLDRIDIKDDLELKQIRKEAIKRAYQLLEALDNNAKD